MTAQSNPRDVSKALDEVWDLVEAPTTGQVPEPGFPSNGLEGGEIQFRKACRSLDLVDRLLFDKSSSVYHERYYSNAIEACFHAIERSCNAGLLFVGNIQEGESPTDHGYSYRNSHLLGLWDQEMAGTFDDLHDRFRSKNYYRTGEGTRERAEAMLRLAQQVHQLVRDHAKTPKDSCVCKDTERGA